MDINYIEPKIIYNGEAIMRLMNIYGGQIII